MSQDIIEMAREAGLKVGTNLSGIVLVGSPADIGLAHLTIEEVERFAALVAAAAVAKERDRVYFHYCKDFVQEAVAAEREACARILDDMADDMAREMEPSTAIAWVRSKAAVIRNRSNRSIT